MSTNKTVNRMCSLYKKNKVIIWTVLILILIPIALHIGYKYVAIIPTTEELPSNVWLLFFGSYLGGVATLIAVYISMQSNNKANKILIERQWCEKKFAEYKQSLLSNVEVMSFADFRFLLASMQLSMESLIDKKNVIMLKKREIYKYDVAFSIVSNIEDNPNASEEEVQYWKCWRSIVKRAFAILDTQSDIIQVGKENIRNNELVKMLNEKANRTLDKYPNKIAGLISDEYKGIKEEINQVKEKLEKNIADGKAKREIVKEMNTTFLLSVNQLFQLTISLLEAKEKALPSYK